MHKYASRKAGRVLALGAVTAFALCSFNGAWAQQKAGAIKKQIVGTWSLAEQWVERDGKRIERFGSNPKGILIYEGNGHVAAILLRADLPKIASNNALTATADENKAIVQGSTAFYGTWTVNEKDGTIKTHIDSSTYPNWDGQDQQRTVSISGGELKSCVPGAQIGGTACTVWKRVK